MFQVNGHVEEIGQLEEGHGFIVASGDVKIRVTGLPPEYVRELGVFLYSAVSVLIDTTADSASG